MKERGFFMEDLLKVFWKTVITFVVLVVLLRIMGKKLLSQMTFLSGNN